MNNTAFKNLISTQSTQNDAVNGFKQPATGTLGSRARSSVPMTPRSIPGSRLNKSEFARQIADATSDAQSEPPFKKFKSSSAPKGTRLASGYVDRTSLRRDNDVQTEHHDKEKRLQALEEMMKLQQIDEETFEKLRDEIGIGGDVGSTHLVKGLDWKLLDRVRRGEDINKNPESENEHVATGIADVDAELEQELEKDIVAKSKDRTSPEKGTETLTEHEPQSMSRDEILRRLKQSRNASTLAQPVTQAVAAPVLNDKFKKIQVKTTGPTKEKFTETINGRRREVLVIKNPDGTMKRKTRWIDPEPAAEQHAEIEHLQEETAKRRKKAVKPNVMGMDVPADIAAREAARQAAEAALEEDEDDDIFQGIGADYDPLADIKSDSGSETDSKKEEGEDGTRPSDMPGTESAGALDPSTTAPAVKRNYFGTSLTDDRDDDSGNTIPKDPTILAALKRAAEIRRREEQDTSTTAASGSGVDNAGDSAKSKAFLAKLRERDRQDAADMDMSFGDSRFADDDDEGDDGQVLHDFHDDGEDDGKNGGQRGGNKTRKRGPKKRKGDKNDVRDVMGVLEARKK